MDSVVMPVVGSGVIVGCTSTTELVVITTTGVLVVMTTGELLVIIVCEGLIIGLELCTIVAVDSIGMVVITISVLIVIM